jgi:hypothetical protein
MSTGEAAPPSWRASVGILVGALLGGLIYAGARALMPPQVSVAAVLVGVVSGMSARLARALGTPAELRILIFGTLFSAVGGEYIHYTIEGGEGIDPFTRNLIADPEWLLLTVFFVTAGIFVGVRILVGNDPLGDLKSLEAPESRGLWAQLKRRARNARSVVPAVRPEVKPPTGGGETEQLEERDSKG